MNLQISLQADNAQVMNGLYKISAVAALIAGSLLVTGALDPLLKTFCPAIVTGWLTLFQKN